MAAEVQVRVAYVVNTLQQHAQSRISKLVLPLQSWQVEYGSVHLKPCLKAVCVAQPELSEADYSVACLDFQETELQQASRAAALQKGFSVSPVKPGQSSKVWEGKGMLSWVMQEAGAYGDTQISGKLDKDSNTLHVSLQLSERKPLSKRSFFDALNDSDGPKLFGNGVCVDEKEENKIHINLIQPTPDRDTDHTPLNLLHTSSPSVQKASVTGTGSLAASPTISQTASALAPTLNDLNPSLDKTQIALMVQHLVPQLQASISSSENAQSKSHVVHLLQTLVTYLNSSPKQSPSNKNVNKVVIDNDRALEAMLSSLAGKPNSIPHLQDDVSATTGKRKRRESKDGLPQMKKIARIEAEYPTSDPIAPIKLQSANNMEPKKPKFDEVGCSNCHSHWSAVWRKRKNTVKGPDGKPAMSKLCNACGIYFNRHGSHRPLEAAELTENTNQALLQSPRRSPRNKGRTSTVGQSSMQTDRIFDSLLSEFGIDAITFSATPGLLNASVMDHPMPRQMRDVSVGSAGSALSSFDGQSLFEDKSARSDTFSALTSDFDFNLLGKAGESRSDSSGDLTGQLGATSRAYGSIKTGLTSDVFSDLDLASLPPSSPPKPTSNPFPHLALSDMGDSPNWPAEASNDTLTRSNVSCGLSQITTPSLDPLNAASDIVWSNEALMMLQNALLPSKTANQLEDTTLQDLFHNLTNGSFDLESTIDSPVIDSPPDSQGLGFNVHNVADVNANVALQIWNEVVPSISSALPKSH